MLVGDIKFNYSHDIVEYESNFLEKIEYDDINCILRITFRNGNIYRYYNFSLITYNNFINSPNKSKFYNVVVNRHYLTEKEK